MTNPKLYCTRAALTVALLAVCVGPSRADRTAEDVYARTLRGTALILTPTGTGTGWVIDLEQGILVTNEHVVTTHEKVDVIFPTHANDGRPVAERSHYRRHAQRFAAEVIDVVRDLRPHHACAFRKGHRRGRIDEVAVVDEVEACAERRQIGERQPEPAE